MLPIVTSNMLLSFLAQVELLLNSNDFRACNTISISLSESYRRSWRRRWHFLRAFRLLKSKTFRCRRRRTNAAVCLVCRRNSWWQTEFFHWFSEALSLIFVLILSRICLLIRPISLFAGLISLQVGLLWKLSLWPLRLWRFVVLPCAQFCLGCLVRWQC